MTAPIIYFDNGSIPISEAESANLKSYIKVYLDENHEFKVIEFIKGGTVEWMEYFINEEETIGQVFEKYPSFESITFYSNKEKKGDFAKYNVDIINRDGIINNKRIQVLGSGLMPIYDKAIDVNNGSTLFFEKYYHDYEKDIGYEFEYDAQTGECTKISVDDPKRVIDTDDSFILPSEIGKDKNPFNFDWEGFEYYKSAEPILPII